MLFLDIPNPCFMREYSDFWMSVTSYRNDLSNLRWSKIPGWALGKLRGLKHGTRGGPLWTSKGTNRTRSRMDQFRTSTIRITAARLYRPAPYSGRDSAD